MLKHFRRQKDSAKTISKMVDPGIEAVADRLDPSFYRLVHPDLSALDEDEARAHWLQYGQHEGRLPNAEKVPSDFNAISYLYLNRDLGADLFEVGRAMRHYVEFGRDEARPYVVPRSDGSFLSSFKRYKGENDDSGDPRFAWMPLALLPYLYVNGLTDNAFLERFDRQFYREAFIDVESGSIRRDHSVGDDDAMFHFVEHGVASLHPIAPDVIFDIAYHRRLLRRRSSRDLMLDDAALYRLWLSEFDLERFPPNHADFMKLRFGVACNSDEIADLAVYRLANRDLEGIDDDDALLEHVFTDGLF